MKRSPYPGGTFDRRPCVGEGFVTAPNVGLYADCASRITLRDFTVNGGLPPMFVNCTEITK